MAVLGSNIPVSAPKLTKKTTMEDEELSDEDGPIAEGWKREWDPNHNRRYYAHPATNTAVWEKSQIK